MKQILKEELSIIPHEIDDETREVLSIFQDLIALLFKHYHSSQYGDKRGGLQTVKNFKELKRSLSRFHNYPFIQTVMRQIDAIGLELIDRIQAKREFRRDNDDLGQIMLKAKQAWMSQDLKQVFAMDSILKQKATVYQRAHKSEEAILSKRFNPMYIENPLIFQSSNFLETFERSQMEEVIEKDLNRFKYSYLKLPTSKHSDFQFVAYFILALKDNQDPVVLTNKRLRKFFDMAYSDDNYKKMIADVRAYLSGNDKSKIPLILQQMKKFPEIEQANEAAIAKLTQVYRGVPLDDGEDSDSESRITVKQAAARDKQQPYLATTDQPWTAKNFALRRGHLESDDTRRVEDGVIFTYELGPGAAILDTTIFGGIFGEGEIIIDPSKAKMVDYRMV